MKTFTRKRTLKELKAFCRKKGWQIDTSKHDREGTDHVVIDFKVGDVFGRALFSTANGRIFGFTDPKSRDGEVHFSSDDTKHEGASWFDALLEAAYV